MEKQNIVDFHLSLMSMEYKQNFLYQLDLLLKHIHEQGAYVTDFNPDSIFISETTRTPSFSQIRPFRYAINHSNDIKRANLLWMADLAFCLYLPEYNLENGLLNLEVVSTRFSDFREYFPKEDADYYASIFEMDYQNSELSPLYYSDYVDQRTVSASSKEQTRTYVKSTSAGKALSTEEGYVSYILMMSVVGALLLLGVFIFSIF